MRVLSVVAGILLAEFVMMYLYVFRFAASAGNKATGLAVIAGVLRESAVSPLFWTLAVAFSVLFFAAGRLHSGVLRAFLFWTPTLLVSLTGFCYWALITYFHWLSRNSQ